MIGPLRRLIGSVIPGRPDECALIFGLIGASEDHRVMVDVGACVGSSLGPFASDGWEVHAFEPDVRNREQLVEVWGGQANVRIDHRALGREPDPEAPIYTSEVSRGISSLTPFHQSHVQHGTVEVTTLSAYRSEHDVRDVGFLKVDTEGFDLFVLKGNDWSLPRPRVVLCEFEDRKTEPLGYSLDDLAGFLVERGYHLVVSEWYPVVEYGGQHRWRRFWTYPGSPAADDSWGNVIAIRDDVDMDAVSGLLRRTSWKWRLGSTLRRLAGR